MKNKNPYIIAELANAHNGDFDTLMKLVDAAASTKADAIKFQWFSPDTLSLKDFEWYDVYIKLMFTEDEWDKVIARCVEHGLEIWADATDHSALDRIKRHEDKITGIKIAATGFLDMDLVTKVLAFDKTTLIGIGGHTDEVIERHINLYKQYNPDIIPQHGVQSYPTQPEDATMARIAHLKAKTGLPQSFADHEDGSSDLALLMPQYAFFAGASIIEKHICLDRESEPYDYFSSLNPAEFTTLVASMDQCTKIMGTSDLTENQRKYLKAATYAIAIEDMKSGDVVFTDQLKFRRTSQQGILNPDEINTVLPARLTQDIAADQGITSDVIKPFKIVATVPCRMKSSRLKKKALLEIDGLPSIERCMINAMSIPEVDETVLVTSTHPDDDALEEFAKAKGYKCIRGSEEDVLERMLKAGEEYNADIVLRITGDCPVVSFEIMSDMIHHHIKNDLDASYCHNHVPVGTVGDVYTFDALKKLREKNKVTDFSEYLIMYFINNPEIFKAEEFVPDEYYQDTWRVTLDEDTDLELLRQIFDYADVGSAPLAYVSLKNFFKENPDASKINDSTNLVYKTDPKLIETLKQKTKIAS